MAYKINRYLKFQGYFMATKTIRVGMLLLPNFSNLGLALAIEPLFIANWLRQATLFDWEIISLTGGNVASSNGMSQSSTAISMDDIDFDIVFVFASFESHQYAKNKEVGNWLRKVYLFGSQVAGIEMGTEALAAAGLLNDKEAAIHWDNISGFQALYPRVLAKSQLYTIEPRLMTCAGAIAILDLILLWMADKVSIEISQNVSSHLFHGRIRLTDQFRQIPEEQRNTNITVQSAIQLMTASLECPLSCVIIAKRVGISLRQLERLFQDQLSISPRQYYQRLRLTEAHRLLQQTALSVTDIALKAGFYSPEHFSRAYKKCFGCRPSDDRKQSTDSPTMKPLTD
ncbi:MAG: AraC family carnitine catabolism transcriptional activator [Gammaproteobacteria bacterium]|jgi:AraC family carnitine catabolism transcriptional activator